MTISDKELKCILMAIDFERAKLYEKVIKKSPYEEEETIHQIVEEKMYKNKTIKKLLDLIIEKQLREL